MQHPAPRDLVEPHQVRHAPRDLVGNGSAGSITYSYHKNDALDRVDYENGRSEVYSYATPYRQRVSRVATNYEGTWSYGYVLLRKTGRASLHRKSSPLTSRRCRRANVRAPSVLAGRIFLTD